MRNYVICGVILLISLITFSCGAGGKDQVIFYYNSEAIKGIVKNKYVINSDKTAKIIYEYTWDGTSKVFDTYWQEGSDGSLWIKSDLSGFEVIKDNVLYVSVADSKAKTNGTPLKVE